MQTCREFLLHPGSWDDIKRLVNEADDLDAVDSRGRTMLHYIVYCLRNDHHANTENILRTLIVRGADIDLHSDSGRPAVDRCHQQWVCDLLVDLGANVDPLGRTRMDRLLTISTHPAGPTMADRRSIRFIVLATHKFCEDMARMVAEMVT